MKRIKLLGVALIAMLSLSGLAAAASQAAATLPSALPNATFAEPITGTNSSGATIFGTSLFEIESPSSSGTQEWFSPKLGLFIFILKEVGNTTLGVKCTGLNKITAGEVEFLGTDHIRDYKTGGGALKIAYILLLLPVHFSCGSSLEMFSGCMAGAATPENTLTKTITVNFKGTANDKDNEIVTVLSEENTANELCQFLVKEGTTATKLATWTQDSTLTGFKRAGVEVTILLMPL
jgi:hypothetical protein